MRNSSNRKMEWLWEALCLLLLTPLWNIFTNWLLTWLNINHHCGSDMQQVHLWSSHMVWIGYMNVSIMSIVYDLPPSLLWKHNQNNSFSDILVIWKGPGLTTKVNRKSTHTLLLNSIIHTRSREEELLRVYTVELLLHAKMRSDQWNW